MEIWSSSLLSKITRTLNRPRVEADPEEEEVVREAEEDALGGTESGITPSSHPEVT